MASNSTLWRDMVHVALRSIRGQVLRTSLTVGIIGIGIMALIAMVTATESLKANVRQEFSALGTQSFSIDQMRSGGMFGGKRVLPSSPIDFREAVQFKEEASGSFEVATSVYGTGMATVTRGSERTDPNVSVQGVDDLYLLTETAEPFFAKRGYGAIPRADAPAAIAATEELSSLCPDSAVLMHRAIAPPAR